MKAAKKCDHCEEEYIPVKFGYSKYCSAICRSRAKQKRNGTDAKDIGCKGCGELFKRRSARDILCMQCKKVDKLEMVPANKDKVFPKLDRGVEVSMINNWLKNNEVTYG